MDATLYDAFAAMDRTHWWFQGRRAIVTTVLEDRLASAPSSPSILDVGCGTGEMLEMLAAFGPVKGIDMSPVAVEHCRSRFGAGIEVSVGRIPEDVTGPVDLVTAFDVIEHLDDDVDALVRIRHALMPGGVFVCTVPAYPLLWSRHDELNHHRRRYTRRSLTRALEAGGFRVERMSYFNSVLFPAVAALRLATRPLEWAGLRRGDDRACTGVAIPRPSANRLLYGLFAAERFLLRRVSLPFGLSLLAVCTPQRDVAG